MINEVRNALNAITGSATNLKQASGAGRVFELYVMTGIGRALIARGYNVWIQRSDGRPILPTDPNRDFIQRGGAPTGIAPAALGSGNASSIVFRRAHRPPWALLNGIQFEGRSRARHEIDLAIVPESVVRTLRDSQDGGRPIGRPRVSIECKDVGTNGSVEEMRAFVARLYDITILRAHHRYLEVADPPKNIHPDAPLESIHNPVPTYWRENRRTLNVLARRTGFTSGVASLAGYYAVEPHDDLTVGSCASTQLMNCVADWIRRRGY